jgi:hypothetical protein
MGLDLEQEEVRKGPEFPGSYLDRRGFGIVNIVLEVRREHRGMVQGVRGWQHGQDIAAGRKQETVHAAIIDGRLGAGDQTGFATYCLPLHCRHSGGSDRAVIHIENAAGDGGGLRA